MRKDKTEVSIKDVDNIKEIIRRLHEKGEMITVDYHSNHPRINIEKSKVRISGVYRNFFTIEDTDCGIIRSHTVMYVDVITKNLYIYELDDLRNDV